MKSSLSLLVAILFEIMALVSSIVFERDLMAFDRVTNDSRVGITCEKRLKLPFFCQH